MRLAIRNVKPRFENFVETKKFFCGEVFSFCSFTLLSLLSLIGTQLYFQIVLLNDFGSRKERVEKH